MLPHSVHRAAALSASCMGEPAMSSDISGETYLSRLLIYLLIDGPNGGQTAEMPGNTDPETAVTGRSIKTITNRPTLESAQNETAGREIDGNSGTGPKYAGFPTKFDAFYRE